MGDATMLDLGHKYGCNKPDGVLAWYAGLFSGFDRPNLLEIGVNHGGSTCMLRDYFKNQGIICGFDIKLNQVRWDMGNIRLSAVDQSRREDLDRGCKEVSMESFDVIIEDGSHIMAHQQITLGHMFKKIKSGGVYIIEDLHTSLSRGHAQFLQGCPLHDTTLAVVERAQSHNSWTTSQCLGDELDYLNKHTADIQVFSCWFHRKAYNDSWGRSINAAIFKK